LYLYVLRDLKRAERFGGDTKAWFF
jgi:hypothetical protein